MTSAEITRLVSAKALQLGFYACGFAPSGRVDSAAERFLRQWLTEGKNAGMGYMEANLGKRIDTTSLVEGSTSVISVAMPYYPAKRIPELHPQIAYYAYGKDYHDVVKRQLRQLWDYILQLCPQASGRIFCDTAPLLEKYWAWRAGLGWIGRHTQLIIPDAGSFFFLGEIVCNVPFNYGTPQPNRCGACTRCVDACPMSAIGNGLDARKCLSYLTIEHKGNIPSSATKALGNRIYGCDACAKACPWNKNPLPTSMPDFEPDERLFDMDFGQWRSLTIEQYRELFRGSAIKRCKYDGLMRNIQAAKHNEE